MWPFVTSGELAMFSGVLQSTNSGLAALTLTPKISCRRAFSMRRQIAKVATYESAYCSLEAKKNAGFATLAAARHAGLLFEARNPAFIPELAH